MKALSSSAKGFGRITLMLLLFTLQAGQGKSFPGSYLIHCTDGEGADSNQAMLDSLSTNTAAFPSQRQTRQVGLCRRFRLPSCNGIAKPSRHPVREAQEQLCSLSFISHTMVRFSRC